MSCDLSRGRALECRDQVGGVKFVWFIAYENLPTLTVDGDEQITAFDTGSDIFYKYNLQTGGAGFTQAIQVGEGGTPYYENTLEIDLQRLTKEDRKEITLMARNTLCAVIEDFNGNVFFAGTEGGLTVTGGEVKTGKAIGDMSGYSLILTGQERTMAKFFTPYTTEAFDGLTGATVATASNVTTVTTA